MWIYWHGEKREIVHTFDHDHVDVYGADGRLRQTLAFLQQVWDLTGGDSVIRLPSKSHQLPDGHSCVKDRPELGHIHIHSAWRWLSAVTLQWLHRQSHLDICLFICFSGYILVNSMCAEFCLTIAPHITLVGELSVVDTFQGHPLDWHLTEKHTAIILSLCWIKKLKYLPGLSFILICEPRALTGQALEDFFPWNREFWKHLSIWISLQCNRLPKDNHQKANNNLTIHRTLPESFLMLSASRGKLLERTENIVCFLHLMLADFPESILLGFKVSACPAQTNSPNGECSPTSQAQMRSMGYSGWPRNSDCYMGD